MLGEMDGNVTLPATGQARSINNNMLFGRDRRFPLL